MSPTGCTADPPSFHWIMKGPFNCLETCFMLCTEGVFRHRPLAGWFFGVKSISSSLSILTLALQLDHDLLYPNITVDYLTSPLSEDLSNPARRVLLLSISERLRTAETVYCRILSVEIIYPNKSLWDQTMPSPSFMRLWSKWWHNVTPSAWLTAFSGCTLCLCCLRLMVIWETCQTLSPYWYRDGVNIYITTCCKGYFKGCSSMD